MTGAPLPRLRIPLMSTVDLTQAFPVGAVSIPFCGLSDTQSKTEDWVPLSEFRFNWATLALRPLDSHLVEAIDFLVRTGFAHATIKNGLPSLDGVRRRNLTHIRVYVVFADSPGHAVWLREAKSTTLSSRTELLRYVLERTDVSTDAWEGLKTSGGIERPFFECCILGLPQTWEDSNALLSRSETLSTMFRNLPSPKLDRERMRGSTERIESVLDLSMQSEMIPGLRSTLYPYQGKPYTQAQA